MKNGSRKIFTLILAICLFLSQFPFKVSVQAGNLSNSYDQLAQQFPGYITQLKSNGASEEQIRAFVNDLDTALQGQQLTQENFKNALLGAALQLVGQERHKAVVTAILQAYRNDIPDLLNGNIPSGFQPLYNVLKDKLLGSSPGGGGGGAPPGQNTPEQKKEPIPPNAPSAPVSSAIKAASGGTVSTTDSAASVTIPANALSGDGTVNISEVTGANIPTTGVNLRVGNRVFNITLTGANLTNTVTLVFQYDLAKFEGVSADQIGLYYYNEGRGAWFYIGGDVDTATGKVTAELNHFTKFTVMSNPELPVLSDIAGHWARGDIKRLVGLLAIKGYPDDTFKPESNITRAEFATVLAKAMGWQPNPGAVRFADAATIPDWARGCVSAAVAKGVISGYEDNTFQPDRLVTRAELAVMVVKAMGKGVPGGELQFTDAASVPSWATGFVSAAAGQGIIKGMPGNVFKPDDTATRAEASAMISRLLRSLKI